MLSLVRLFVLVTSHAARSDKTSDRRLSDLVPEFAKRDARRRLRLRSTVRQKGVHLHKQGKAHRKKAFAMA